MEWGDTVIQPVDKTHYPTDQTPWSTNNATVKIHLNQKYSRILFTAPECVGGSKKFVDHIPQAEIYLGYMSRRGAQT